MNVQFFALAKRPNSTARPNLSGGSVYDNIQLKGPCSIRKPVIEINMGPTNDPVGFNYCYIPAFERYYFVNDWVNDGPLWIAYLKEDELATFKPAIGASTQYILRSSHSSDGYIIDNLYPAYASRTFSVQRGSAMPYDNLGPQANTYCYVIGIVNDDTAYTPARIGAVTYYAFTPEGMGALMDALMDPGTLTGFNAASDNISEPVFKSLYDPIQYVVSCMFCPITPETRGTPPTTLKVGLWNVTINSGVDYVNLNAIPANILTVTIPKHPQAATRGAYLNQAPYSQYALDFRPFGYIPLPSEKLANYSTLYLWVKFDPVAGVGRLNVCVDAQYSNVIYTQTAMIGVPIQLAQMSRDYIGAAANLVGGIAGVAAGIGMGNIPGAIMSGASAIGNAALGMVPETHTQGANGSLAEIQDSQVSLYVWFTPVVDEDNADRGRPLCKKGTISDYPGYLVIADPDVSINEATQEEMDAIRSYMEQGFFYE